MIKMYDVSAICAHCIQELMKGTILGHGAPPIYKRNVGIWNTVFLTSQYSSSTSTSFPISYSFPKLLSLLVEF